MYCKLPGNKMFSKKILIILLFTLFHVFFTMFGVADVKQTGLF